MPSFTAIVARVYKPVPLSVCFCFAFTHLDGNNDAVITRTVGLVNNGAFETVPAGGASGSGLGEGVASLPGWTINGTVELVESGQKQGGMILIVPEGNRATVPLVSFARSHLCF